MFGTASPIRISQASSPRSHHAGHVEVEDLNSPAPIEPEHARIKSTDLKTRISVVPFYKTYKPIWNDKGIASRGSVTFYRLHGRRHKAGQGLVDVSSMGYRILGDLARQGHKMTNPKPRSYVVHETGGRDDLEEFFRKPISYEMVWSDAGTSAKREGAIWKPIAPPGFIALGYVVTDSHEAPDKEMMRCVHHSLTERGKLSSNPVWTDGKASSKSKVSIWRVLPEDEETGVDCNTFIAVNSYKQPGGVPRVLSKRHALLNLTTHKPERQDVLMSGDTCPMCGGVGRLGVFGACIGGLDEGRACPCCNTKGVVSKKMIRCPLCSGEGGSSAFGPCSTRSLFYQECVACGGAGYVPEDSV